MVKYWASLFAALVIGVLTGSIWAEDIGKQIISTPNAPSAVGPYSQAIRVGQTVYLAGQIAIDPNTNQPMSGATIEEQTRRVLDNISAVLAAGSLSMADIVSTTVYLTDVNDFGKMNEVYGTYFKDAPPARTTVGVARLPRDMKIEISAIAVAP